MNAAWLSHPNNGSASNGNGVGPGSPVKASPMSSAADVPVFVPDSPHRAASVPVSDSASGAGIPELPFATGVLAPADFVIDAGKVVQHVAGPAFLSLTMPSDAPQKTAALPNGQECRCTADALCVNETCCSPILLCRSFWEANPAGRRPLWQCEQLHAAWRPAASVPSSQARVHA